MTDERCVYLARTGPDASALRFAGVPVENNFPVPRRRELGCNQLNLALDFELLVVFGGSDDENPCIFACYQGIWLRDGFARVPGFSSGRRGVVAAPVCLNCRAICWSWRCRPERSPPRATSCIRYATARTSRSRLRCGDASVL